MNQDVATLIQNGELTSLKQKLIVTFRLSVPAMIAQLTSIVMQYIDSAMVGTLGADASAAIGLISAVIWLVDGITFAAVYAFTVQISHRVGANDLKDARNIYKLGIVADLLFALALMTIGLIIRVRLPLWLGGTKAVAAGATQYLTVYLISLPFVQIERLASTSLQANGNMKVPALFEASMCLLDIVFNALFIFPSGVRTVGALHFYLPGAGLGVTGASIGTALSRVVVMVILFSIAATKTEGLRFIRGEKIVFQKLPFIRAWKIFWPACLERIFINGAMIATTWILAPLGTIAIAANSFATTAESVCYMAGYGVAAAAQTLVGQSIGAGDDALARSFAWITTLLGAVLMAALALLMYFVCPAVMAFLTPVVSVRALAVKSLRAVLYAEAFYGISIVAVGALRGAGDTLVPSIMSLISIWGVRVPLFWILIHHFGLVGGWTAMAIELIFRGVMFLVRLHSPKWTRALTTD